MKKLSRKWLWGALKILIALLAIIIFTITFASSKYIPTWGQIAHELFGYVPDDLNSNYVRFIDVGQGDSVLINSNGAAALIDLGPEPDDGEELLNDLLKFGVYKLDCVILSHYDSDHIGGDEVLRRLKVDNIIMPQVDEEVAAEESNSFYEFEYAAKQSGANIYLAQVGTKITVGDFVLTVVAYYPEAEDSNETSVMVMAEADGRRFLFTGDAGRDTEAQLLNDGYTLDCDVFKAAHHGSRYSNSLEFLETITPTYTVVSCGSGNTYGHPHAEVLTNLSKAKSLIYRTDIHGNITFYVENGNITVKTEK